MPKPKIRNARGRQPVAATDPVRKAPGSRLQIAGLGFGLFVLVMAVYFRALRNGFINFDDPMYITANPRVQHGFSIQSIRWAFTTFEGGFWHPLTWLSIMGDCAVFGLHPAGHHFVASLIHAINSVLIFLVFYSLTGGVWRSFFPAALFGLHPLHVESVAWASERKDILSTTFALLAIWAYAKYAGGYGYSDESRSRSRLSRGFWYSLTLFLFVLGLMSKSMIVTLPLVFLLLDFWPLRRIYRMRDSGRSAPRGASAAGSFGQLLLEKAPFFVLSACLSGVTVLAQQRANAVGSALLYPFTDRVANAVISYGTYALQAIWPAGLAVYYPYSKSIPVGPLIAAMVFFCSVSIFAVLQFRTRPFLLFGWLWYVLTLLPVIGLIQAGGQAHADRYTYIPLIGVFVALGFAVHDLVKGRPQLLQGGLIMASAVLAACAVATHRQIGFWKDSETLFSHTLQVTSENELAENNFGTALIDLGRPVEALPHFQEAVRIMPDFAEARNNLGSALGKAGRYDEAVTELQQALKLDPASVAAHCNLADAHAAQGDFTTAISHYEQAVKLKPGDPTLHFNLGLALAGSSKFEEAISHYRESVRLEPGNPEAHNKLGMTLAMTGRLEEGIAELRKTVQAKPDFAEGRCNLGIALVQAGQFSSAVAELNKALELNPEYALAHCNLGVALGRLGDFNAAVLHLQKALEIQPDYKEARENLRLALAQQAQGVSAPRQESGGRQ